jgi:hypothetical protein
MKELSRRKGIPELGNDADSPRTRFQARERASVAAGCEHRRQTEAAAAAAEEEARPRLDLFRPSRSTSDWSARAPARRL